MEKSLKCFDCLDYEAIEVVEVFEEEFFQNAMLFVALYLLCFSDPPYSEKFSAESVLDLARKKWFADGGALKCVRDKQTGVIYAYVVTYPVVREESICSALNNKVDNLSGCLYVAEILTRPEWRRNGFADMCLRNVLRNNSDRNIIVRTHKDNVASQRLFKRAGFVLLDNVYETVVQERVGKLSAESDDRIFLIHYHSSCLHQH